MITISEDKDRFIRILNTLKNIMFNLDMKLNKQSDKIKSLEKSINNQNEMIKKLQIYIKAKNDT